MASALSARRRLAPLVIAATLCLAMPTLAAGFSLSLPFTLLQLPSLERARERVGDMLLLPQSQQVELGRLVAAEQGLERRGARSPQLDAVAERMTRALTGKYKGRGVTDGWVWDIKVLKTDDGAVNALALPGGKVFVTDGLLKLTGDRPDELAAVVGHEMAHITEQHGAKQLRMAGCLARIATWAQQAISGEGEESWQTQMMADLATRLGATLVERQLSREAEYKADEIGFAMLTAAGYSPQSGLRVLSTLQSLETPRPGRAAVLGRAFSTHPPTQERIRRLQERLGSTRQAHAARGRL